MLVAFVIGRDKIGRYLGEFYEHEIPLLQHNATQRGRKIFVRNISTSGLKHTFTIKPKKLTKKR